MVPHLMLIRCNQCESLVWRDEMEIVREYDSLREPKDVKLPAYDFMNQPSFNEYMAYLKKFGAKPDKERYIRQNALWMGNHVRREGGNLLAAGILKQIEVNAETPLTEVEIENLEILLTLLDVSDEIQRLSKADGLRQLGRFSEALRLLKDQPPGPLTVAHKVLRDLAQLSDPKVAKIE